MGLNILNSPIERFTRLLFSKVIERLAVVVSEEQLTFSQVASLHIVDREINININDLSNRLNLSVSATSRMINELVKKKLIKRKEDKDNRRSKIITLTSSGKLFMNNLSIERVMIIEEAGMSKILPSKLFKVISSKLVNKN
jgi:DNA-binding MarR family transcriptional regulator